MKSPLTSARPEVAEEWLKHQWELVAGSEQNSCFRELLNRYAEPQRHYHTLQHIHALLSLTGKYISLISRPDLLRLAIWYHDAVYNPQREDNEEQSAILARKHLTEMAFPPEVIATVEQYILATKRHSFPPGTATPDGLFFLDLDLSILAAPPDQYDQYTRQIREEFSRYPGFLYRSGRKKVMKHFLDKPRIYLTPHCHEMWEKKARENLTRELQSL